jgi:hypothetical protein
MLRKDHSETYVGLQGMQGQHASLGGQNRGICRTAPPMEIKRTGSGLHERPESVCYTVTNITPNPI